MTHQELVSATVQQHSRTAGRRAQRQQHAQPGVDRKKRGRADLPFLTRADLTPQTELCPDADHAGAISRLLVAWQAVTSGFGPTVLNGFGIIQRVKAMQQQRELDIRQLHRVLSL